MSRSLFRSVVVGLVLVALSAGRASAANKEHQQMMADIRMLQEQGQRLQAQLAALNEVLKTLTTRIDEQAAADRKIAADQKLLIEGIANDLRVVREKADDNNVRLGTLAQDVEALRQNQGAVPSQPGAGTPGNPASPPAAGGAPETTNPPPSGGTNLGMAPSQAYSQALGDYYIGEYQLAINGFENYLRSSARPAQAADAQWYIGESYFGAGNFDQAKAAYQKVIGNYPNSARVPEAYYKLGLVYERLNDKPHAREAFETLIKNYPSNNQSVILAQQRLKKLQSPGGND